MLDLATVRDFEVEDAPIWAAAQVTEFSGRVGTLVLIAAVFATDWQATGAAFWGSLGFAIAVGVGLGLAAAGVGWVLTRRGAGRKLDDRLLALLAGDPRWVPPAPDDASARLLCGLIVADGRICGAMLYVCHDRLVLQPHYPRRRIGVANPPAAPSPILIQPARTITLSDGLLAPPPRRRGDVGPGPLPVLVVSCGDGSIALRVPRTAEIRRRLQAQLDLVRDRAG